eukprot:4874561-Heterocapsa_arctica.AAC.1
MNNKFCSSYTHKRCKNLDSDNSDTDSENNFPGHKVRIEAYNRMMENHTDKIFQQKEDKEANRLRKSRKFNQTKDKEELDQLHKYVHAGILQQMMQEGKNHTGQKIEPTNDDKDQQHIAGEDHEKQDTNEVHTQ